MQRQRNQPLVFIVRFPHKMVHRGLACAVAADAELRRRRNVICGTADDTRGDDELGVLCELKRSGCLKQADGVERVDFELLAEVAEVESGDGLVEGDASVGNDDVEVVDAGGLDGLDG